jgi:hypothetical protein
VDDFKLRHLPPEYAIDAGMASISRARDTVAVPVFWIVLLLSLLLHVAVLYWLPPLRFALQPPVGDPDIPMAVELKPRLRPPQGIPDAPASTPKPDVAPPARAVAPSPPPRRATVPAPRVTPPAPPVIAQAPPAPKAMPSPVKPEPAAPERAQPPSGDLASYVESRRRARNESAPVPTRSEAVPESPPDDDVARSNRIVAANLGLGRAPTFGGEPRPGGGVFQVTRLNYSDAELLFFGWNKEIRRNTTQRIEVRKGEHSDIEVAVVRRMIAIVREYESGDFRWESRRLGRDVMLSARPRDNAGLEDFLMREFFDGPRQP